MSNIAITTISTINDYHTSALNSFKQLHQTENPLILINIWDAASAVLMQDIKATAVATSSASLAWSLGYADGDHLPKEELLAAVKRILRVLNIPLSVDIETGYSNDISDVVALATDLTELGVVGINIEDGTGSPALLSEKINAIKTQKPHLFINARCDVYLASLAAPDKQFNETLRRLEMYKNAGADGVFVPGLEDTDLANELQNKLQLPINLMANKNANINHFKDAGVPRISVGPASFLNAYATLNDYAPNENIEEMVSYDGLNRLLG